MKEDYLLAKLHTNLLIFRSYELWEMLKFIHNIENLRILIDAELFPYFCSEMGLAIVGSIYDR